jgi:hypothetical protein
MGISGSDRRWSVGRPALADPLEHHRNEAGEPERAKREQHFRGHERADLQRTRSSGGASRIGRFLRRYQAVEAGPDEGKGKGSRNNANKRGKDVSAYRDVEDGGAMLTSQNGKTGVKRRKSR